MSNFSCGTPVFANATTATCLQCKKLVHLRINPRLVGLLADESGAIKPGQLIWSDEAWWQLLGRTAESLSRSSLEILQYLESRLLFLRLAVLFGWSQKVGRIVILRVQIV